MKGAQIVKGINAKRIASSDTTPPSAPSAVAVSPFSATRARVTFAAAADNVAVVRYEVYLDGLGRAAVSGASSPLYLSGLKPGSYSVTVRAFDAAGNASAASTPVAFVVPEAGGSTFPAVEPVTVIDKILFDEFPAGHALAGKFLGTNQASSEGNFAQYLCIFDSEANGFAFLGRITASRATLLMPAGADTTANGSTAFIQGAWITPEGNILFATYETSANRTTHIYYCALNTGTIASSTVGANASSYNDLHATLSLGTATGTGVPGSTITDNCRILSHNNLAFSVRTVYASSSKSVQVKVRVVEYNVNTTRVTGAAKDRAVIWESDDQGKTWANKWECNANGSTRQIDHFHSIIQDPFSDLVIITTGDQSVDGTNSGVLFWDGYSAFPTANTELESWGARQGWNVMTDGTQRWRTVDVLCFEDFLSFMLDCDDDDSGTNPRYGYMSAICDRDGGNVRYFPVPDRVRRLAPTNGCVVDAKKAIGLYCTLRNGVGSSAGDPPIELHIYGTGDGKRYTKIGRIALDGGQTEDTTIYRLWKTSTGRIVCCGLNGRSFKASSPLFGAAAGGSAYSLLFDVIPGGFSGAVNLLNP